MYLDANFNRYNMHVFSSQIAVLKPATSAGFSAMMYPLNVVPLLYLQNEKLRNPSTIKGLRFIQKGLKK